MSRETTLHGTFLTIFGVGVLLTGKPGVGKSELALTLIDRRHQLIADDAPSFYKTRNALIGNNPLGNYYLSIRGIGLVDVLSLFGENSIQKKAPLTLIIHLQLGMCDDPMSHLNGQRSIKDILGCLIPCITIPIIGFRRLDVLVETIVREFLHQTNKDDLPVRKLETLIYEKMELTNS